MKPISLGEVAQIVEGESVSALPEPCPQIHSICTDTRLNSTGSLFVALRGENHDGHHFLVKAAAGGAAAAIVEEPPPLRIPGLHLIQVSNTRTALGMLGRHLREQLSGRVIAVGGANGKTGTKNLIDSILRSRLRGSISPKSFNNDIGVPLAIFAAEPLDDYLVLELGTNHPGEIKTLTQIALPDIAVITNCSAEHLEGLGDLSGVRREESSIIGGLKPDGLLVVHGDDPDLLGAVRSFPRRVTFGLSWHNDLFAADIHCDLAGVDFRLNGGSEVRIPLLGEHVAVNALAAIAVARELGLSDEEIIAALADAHGPDMRLQLQRIGDVTVLNDAYNANPASMKAALKTLSKLDAPGRRIAVLGTMREMGEAAADLHREMGRFIPSCRLDLLVCVGDMAGLIAEEAVKAGFRSTDTHVFSTTAAAAASLPQWLAEGDLLLLKGSRLMKLETIAAALASPDYRKVAS
jgi:UDP-N-acetylmuramoyl-tripeptide--D-alanyl-D-alanine ligase